MKDTDFVIVPTKALSELKMEGYDLPCRPLIMCKNCAKQDSSMTILETCGDFIGSGFNGDFYCANAILKDG